MVHDSGKPTDPMIRTVHLAATNHAVFRQLDDHERQRASRHPFLEHHHFET